MKVPAPMGLRQADLVQRFLLHLNRAPKLLFYCVVKFVGEHSLFGSLAAGAFLAANFFETRARGDRTVPLGTFDLIKQESAGEQAIETLLARSLAFDLQSSRAMQQHDASGSLVDVLAPMASGPDEGLFNVRFTHAESGHALG